MTINTNEVIFLSEIAKANGIARQSITNWVQRGLLTNGVRIRLEVISIRGHVMVSVKAMKKFIADTHRGFRLPDISA